VNTQETHVEVSSCVDITSPGYYYLSSRISGVQGSADRCIGIYADNVVLDGNGYSLEGGGRGDGIFVYKSRNVTVKNIAVRGYDIGITFDGSSNGVIENAVVVDCNWPGIYFALSSLNTIVNVTVKNSQSGIYLYNSSSNTILNTVVSNSGPGIWLVGSSNNTIINVTATGNSDGVLISVLSNGNAVLNSTVVNNVCGLSIGLSSHNTIANNVVSGNTYGLCFQNSSNNLIYNNYFKNLNAIHVYDESAPNTWNTTKATGRNIVGGGYLGGNYWSDPEEKGFSDTCIDSDGDGFCDEPFVIDENNVDYYPLKPQPAPTPAEAVIKPTTPLQTTTPSPATMPPAVSDYVIAVGVGLAIVVAIVVALTTLRREK